MSKERLSKLQKWILKTCYEQGEKRAYGVRRQQLVRRYCQDVKGRLYSISSDQVTLTRSIRNLAFKDYIDISGSQAPIDFDNVLSKEQKAGLLIAKNIKMFWLTDKGITEAEKLLKVKKEKLNFKKQSKFR